MNENIEIFLNLIKASLEEVDDKYYKITTTYEPFVIVRERVFCYELYHQMRLIQERKNIKDIQLHGEIDKRGHVEFDSDARKI